MNVKFNYCQPNFQALKPIPKLAYKIGGEALQEALPELEEMAEDADIEVIPKKGLFSKFQSLNFFVTDLDKNIGRWFSLSVDPKGYLDYNQENISIHYKSVDSFTRENILEAAQKAKDLNCQNGMKVERKTITAMPADAVIIAKMIHDREQKKAAAAQE